MARTEGDPAAARPHFAEALTTEEELEHKILISYTLDGFAVHASGHGDWSRAARLAGAAEQLRESIGSEMEPFPKV